MVKKTSWAISFAASRSFTYLRANPARTVKFSANKDNYPKEKQLI